MRVALSCGAASVALGSVYLLAAGAPLRLVLVDAAALALGVALAALSRRVPPRRDTPHGAETMAIGLVLLGTAMLGVRTAGASRWVAFGGITLQPSLVLVPMALVWFADRRDAPSTVGLALSALALGAQPDRAMAGVLAAGLGALWIVRRDRLVTAAVAAASAGFALAWLQPDIVPPAPYVEGVVPASFALHPLAGLAVVGGLVVLLVPVAASFKTSGTLRATTLVFGATWLAIIAAALLGDYPTPLVGYGSSAVIGYCLSAAALPPPGAHEV